jgi:hypothetical protein
MELPENVLHVALDRRRANPQNGRDFLVGPGERYKIKDFLFCRSQLRRAVLHGYPTPFRFYSTIPR